MNPARWLVLLGALAGGARAQNLMFWYWDLNDTGANTVTIGPGESVTLRLFATWEPDWCYFAEASYDIVGVENWGTGAITRYQNMLDDIYDGPGDLGADNSILGVHSLKLPPFFGHFPEFPPALAYEIDWTPDDYDPRTARLTDTNHSVNRVYVDDFGSWVDYEAAPSEGATIRIVPAPAGVLTLGVVPLVARRRRYRATP